MVAACKGYCIVVTGLLQPCKVVTTLLQGCCNNHMYMCVDTCSLTYTHAHTHTKQKQSLYPLHGPVDQMDTQESVQANPSGDRGSTSRGGAPYASWMIMWTPEVPPGPQPLNET